MYIFLWWLLSKIYILLNICLLLEWEISTQFSDLRTDSNLIKNPHLWEYLMSLNLWNSSPCSFRASSSSQSLFHRFQRGLNCTLEPPVCQIANLTDAQASLDLLKNCSGSLSPFRDYSVAFSWFHK